LIPGEFIRGTGEFNVKSPIDEVIVPAYRGLETERLEYQRLARRNGVQRDVPRERGVICERSDVSHLNRL
jgi:hypothetical protein